MPKKENITKSHGSEGKGATKRSPKADAGKSRTSGSGSSTASPKGNTKGGASGSFGKVSVGKGCLPTILAGILVTLAVIIF